MSHGRKTPSGADRIKSFFWPKKGFVRAWKYIALRIARINTSPHSIAAGFASGAAISVTPLLGLHILLGCALAFVTRGSMIAASLGTLVGNPLTFPLFFSATYWVGARIRDLASAEPTEAYRIVLEGFDEAAETEADLAADAVLDAAEGMIEWGWNMTTVEVIWPVVSTMLIGSIPLLPIAYVLFYLAARKIVRTFGRDKFQE